MNFNALYQNQLLPIHSVPLQQIPTILNCRNSLVRAGIRHTFHGTCYVVADELEDSSNLAASDASPLLYILDESHSSDALAETVANLKAHCSSARVVVLADNLGPTTMTRAVQAGVDGLCSTRTDRAVLLKALELVMLGETFIASAFVLTMLDEASQAPESQPNMTSALMTANDTATTDYNLTSREVDILRRLMEGESNKVIARKLAIAEATIKVHVKSVLRKVRVQNRTQAAMWAAAHLSATSSSRDTRQGTE